MIKGKVQDSGWADEIKVRKWMASNLFVVRSHDNC